MLRDIHFEHVFSNIVIQKMPALKLLMHSSQQPLHHFPLESGNYPDANHISCRGSEIIYIYLVTALDPEPQFH